MEEFRASIQNSDTVRLKNLLINHSSLLTRENWFTNTEGGLLHWALHLSSRYKILEIVEALLNAGCPVNDGRDVEGHTSLQRAVLRGDLAVLTLLLSHEADPNAVTEDGSTALHFAAASNSESSLFTFKALIVFNAEINKKRNDGSTALHIISGNPAPWAKEGLQALHLLGAERCLEWAPSMCTFGCRYIRDEGINEASRQSCYGSHNVKYFRKQTREDDTNKSRLLSLDGGGIRGLVLTQILLCLELMTGKRVQELFDSVIGTSTGGILALGLGCGKSVLSCQGMYFQLKDKVFKGTQPYPVGPLENFYKDVFTEDLKMKELGGFKRVMVTATNVSRIPPELYIYKSFGADEEDDTNPVTSPEDKYVWKAAKTTGAAPYYFQMEHRSLVDGGFVANNPALDGLGVLQSLNEIPSFVLSLGTSIYLQAASPFTLDIHGDAWKWGFDSISSISKIPSFLRLAMELIAASNGPIVDRSKNWCQLINSDFVRLNPEVSCDMKLNEIDNSKLINLMFETRVYMFNLPKNATDILVN